MDQEIRNKLRNVVTQCRTSLEKDIRSSLEGRFRIYEKNGQVIADPNAPIGHLEDDNERTARAELLDYLSHIKARGFKPKDALDQLVREIAFTHLNRLCAYKMMEAREVYIGGQKFREAVSRGINSNGVKFYLADHPEDERLFNTGHQDIAYRQFLDWLGDLLSEEIGVLFSPNDPANRLYPRQKTLDEVLDLLNNGGIKPEETELRGAWPAIWSQDETIGWVYQYFTPKEMREKARSESRAPRNSNELGFRNQFFTPRYVVEYLTDNSLGRTWYEMQQGNTTIKDQCRYMVRRPNEMFLKEGEQPPKVTSDAQNDLSQEELVNLPVRIPHRPKKDPRGLKVLDPACGSGHFLLYCFDLLLTIYEEAYADPDLGPTLQKDYPKLEDLRREVPRLILAHNLHGIDIDLRASQIAALALWLRSQRAYHEMGLKNNRPKINRTNFVCAEPMPGEEHMLREFVGQLEFSGQPELRLLGQLVEVVFDKMKLAGEAGSLLKIEDEIKDTVREAKRQYDVGGIPLQQTFFDKPVEPRTKRFSVQDLPTDEFFERAESKVIEALRRYAEKAQNGNKLQKQLFTEDAERGFAFVDLCHKRFDVVLMNPPFGMIAKNAKEYVDENFPDSKGDILAHFVERALELCEATGFVGVISSRSCFFLGSLTAFRQEVLQKMGRLVCMADFGDGVLDATVETAAYILARQTAPTSLSVFLRILLSLSKATDLLHSIERLTNGESDPNIFLIHTHTFAEIHNSPYAYWVPPKTISMLNKYAPIEGSIASVRVGLQTGDDARFLRMTWEVPANTIGALLTDQSLSRKAFTATLRSTFRNGKRWAFYSKTDYACPWLSPIMLVVDWQDDGDKLKAHFRAMGYSPSKRVQSEDKYFLPGFSYMLRSTRLVPYVVPPGVIPTAGRSQVYAEAGQEIKALGICASRIGSAVARFSGESFARPKFQASMVQNIPHLPLSSDSEVLLRQVFNQAMDSSRAIFSMFEPWQDFRLPAYLDGDTSHNITWQLDTLVGHVIENKIASDVGMTPGEAAALCRDLDEAILIRTQKEEAAETDDASDDDDDEDGGDSSQNIFDFSERAVAAGYASYLIGVVFGRWDIRFALDKTLLPMPQKVLDPLPVVPPSTLIGTDGLPAGSGGIVGENWLRGRPDASHIASPTSCEAATIADNEYPVRIRWDGVLPDDEGNDNDIVRLIRSADGLIPEKMADEGMERRLCRHLGVKTLRDYFRKAGKGGFWDDHVNCYKAKRGRKAPIYWLVQSSKTNYALWLYYHRLDKDMLFKALVNYVEPKIRLETSRLETLRGQKAAAGESGKEAKRLAKEVERFEDLLSELRDFEDKLRRAAKLHLIPDLNDGVALNIAPLHELVPWKVAKSYWEELLEGKYEWSSIGKQLRQKGLVK